MTQTAQIHRFRDKVAIYVGTGETVYLTPREAYQLGQHLTIFAQDCEFVEFVDSDKSTFTIEFEGSK